MRMEDLRLPVVRLQPKTGFDAVLSRTAKLATIVLGIFALCAALVYGRIFLVPLALALTIGLMLSPIASRVERSGVPPAISGVVVTLAFLLLIAASLYVFSVPLQTWMERLPLIWQKLRSELHAWREPISAFSSIREQLKEVTSGSGTDLVVTEASDPLGSLATMAPSLFAQFLLFLAGLYFFVSSRISIRLAVLSLCTSRRTRWRAARIFRDAELLVSRYLISITLINIGLGVAVGLAMAAVGMPSPFLWGALAGVLNYIVYVGPALTAAIIGLVSLATFNGTGQILLPPAVYLFVNFMEAQFVTPYVIGRTMTLNPLVVFLAIAFWLWIWGPVGGFTTLKQARNPLVQSFNKRGLEPGP